MRPLPPRNKPDSPPGNPTQKLQKALAQAGVGSRRQMEEWIRAGRITVNGIAAQLGHRVARSDLIQIDGQPLRQTGDRAERVRVLVYHKPEGEIVSRNDPGGRPSVFDRLPPVRGAKWLAVGRLDFNTGGLLLLTTSGELANRMTHPRYELPREYSVRIRGRVAPADRDRLIQGIALEDGSAALEEFEEQGGEGANRWYRVVVREGRNRLVRRLFSALGLTVSRLMRTRFGPVGLPPRVTRGQYVELPPADVRLLLAAVGLEAGPDPRRPDRPDSPDRSRRPDSPDRSRRPGRPDRSHRPDSPDRSRRPDRPDRSHRPDRPGRPSPAARPRSRQRRPR